MITKATIEITIDSNWFDSEIEEKQFLEMNHDDKSKKLLKLVMRIYYNGSEFSRLDDQIKINFDNGKKVESSLPLVIIDKEIHDMCVELYKSGDKITAIKWLIEEANKTKYHFGIKWASEYLQNIE